MDEAQEVVDRDIEEDIAEGRSKRGKVRSALSVADPSLAREFEELTPKQKAGGELIGKLIVARSWSDMVDAFEWYRTTVNDGVDLTNTQKKEAILVAYGHGSPQDGERSVRILGKLYLKAMFSD